MKKYLAAGAFALLLTTGGAFAPIPPRPRPRPWLLCRCPVHRVRPRPKALTMVMVPRVVRKRRPMAMRTVPAAIVPRPPRRRHLHRRQPRPAANQRRRRPLKSGDKHETSNIGYPATGWRGNDRGDDSVGRMWRVAATIVDDHFNIHHGAVIRATAHLNINFNDQYTNFAITPNPHRPKFVASVYAVLHCWWSHRQTA